MFKMLDDTSQGARAKKQLAIWRAQDWLGYNSFTQLLIFALISGNQKGLPNIIIIEIKILSL